MQPFDTDYLLEERQILIIKVEEQRTSVKEATFKSIYNVGMCEWRVGWGRICLSRGIEVDKSLS